MAIETEKEQRKTLGHHGREIEEKERWKVMEGERIFLGRNFEVKKTSAMSV